MVEWRCMPSNHAFVISYWPISINVTVVIDLFKISCVFQWCDVLHVNVFTYVITRVLLRLAYIIKISESLLQLRNSSIIIIVKKSLQDVKPYLLHEKTFATSHSMDIPHMSTTSIQWFKNEYAYILYKLMCSEYVILKLCQSQQSFY